MHRSTFFSFAMLTLLSTACGGSQGSGFANDAGGGDAEIDAAEEAFVPTFDDGGSLADASKPDGKPSIVNLVQNGDFEKGNLLFGSDYAFATTNTIEGQYTVGLNGQLFNGALVPKGDHTTTKGKMFVGNGKATPDRVWFSSTPITVTPNTQYYFEAWVMNLCCATGLGDGINPVGPSVLSFYANGQLLGTRTSKKLGEWEGLTTNWSSGSATTVTLQLVNANTDAIGNDFGVDDIYLGTESSIPLPN